MKSPQARFCIGGWRENKKPTFMQSSTKEISNLTSAVADSVGLGYWSAGDSGRFHGLLQKLSAFPSSSVSWEFQQILLIFAILISINLMSA